MKTVSLNFDELQGYNPDPFLYNDTVAALNRGPLTGVVEIPIRQWRLRFSQTIQKRLVDFLRGQPPKDWTSHNKTCACNECVSQRTRDSVEHARQEQEEQRPGQERLRAYLDGKVDGYTRLLYNGHNNRLFDEYINCPELDAVRVMLPEHIDAFIQAKKTELLWTLPNGEEQLPLDADNTTMLRASVAQLRDLSKRRGDGQSWFNKAGRSAGNIDVDSSVRSRSQSQVV